MARPADETNSRWLFVSGVVALAFATAALFASAAANGARSTRAGADLFSVTRTLGSMTLTTTVEPNGLADIVRDQKSGLTLGGLLVDYTAGTVVVYDTKHKVVQKMTLAQAEQVNAYHARAAATLKYVYAKRPLPFARGTLTPLKQSGLIGGVPAEAWEYKQGRAVYRLWYPSSSPQIPADVQKQLEALLPSGGAAVAGKVALLEERFDGKTFTPPARAPLVSPESEKDAQQALILPSGLHLGTLIPLQNSKYLSRRRIESIPAAVRRLPVNLLQVHGINPLVAYWGPRLTSAAAAPLRANLDHRISTFYVKAPYVTQLAQYGVHAGAMAQPSITIPTSPFFDIGNSPTTPTIIGHAISMASAQLDRFGDPAWTLFNQDSVPVPVMLVSANEVAVGTVSGYHLALPARGFAGALGTVGFALTLIATGPAGLLSTFDPFLPMVIAPVVPFIVAKVPATGVAAADADSTGFPLTHELNETATDPWGPEVGWADPSKVPFLAASEVGDICSTAFPPTSPFTDITRLNGEIVSTYWSNHDHACVPESRPILKVLGPSHDQTLPPGVSIAVSARCTDRVTGNLLMVTWLVNGAPTPESPPGHLPPPPHGMTERVSARCASGPAVSVSPAVSITGG